MGYKICTIFCITFSLFCINAFSADAATLQFSGNQAYTIGETISIPVLVSQPSPPSLNAVSATVQFPTDKLQLLSINKSPSILSLWTQEPTISNAQGTATFEGVALNPGWIGQRGTVVTLMFKVKAAGAAAVTFTSASVLANDGRGTNILQSAAPLTLSLGSAAPEATTPTALVPGAPLAPVITSPTHPDSTKWYKNSNPVFRWTMPTDVTAVRLAYNTSPLSDPTVEYAPAINEKRLDNVGDGIYYLHAQFKNQYGWGAVSHFKFQIDTGAPLAFTVRLAHSENPKEPRPILYFNTTDAKSGIDYYDVKVGDEKFKTIKVEEVDSNPYSPPPQKPGKKLVVVNAYDRAGNVTSATTEIEIEAIDPPVIESYSNEMEEGDLLRIRGQSYVDARVDIYLKDERGVVTSEYTKTNALGVFGIIWSKRLDPGVYTLTAVVTNDRGAISNPTEPQTVVVKKPGPERALSFISSYLTVALLSIVALAAIVAALILAYHRLMLFRRRLRKAIHATERTIEHDFNLMREDIAEQLASLEKVKNKRDLTKEEKAIIATFRKHLTMVEENIEKSLDKVKEQVD